MEEALRLRDELFVKYGTTMRGLQVEYHLDEEDYLQYVHDVPLQNFLQSNPQLGEMLSHLPQRKVILTNADTRHARRVLSLLGVEGCFEKIIDIRSVAPYCKPMPEAFEAALGLMGEKACRSMLVEDSIKNLAAARGLGFSTVRVGGNGGSEEFDACIDSIMQLGDVIERMEQ